VGSAKFLFFYPRHPRIIFAIDRNEIVRNGLSGHAKNRVACYFAVPLLLILICLPRAIGAVPDLSPEDRRIYERSKIKNVSWKRTSFLRKRGDVFCAARLVIDSIIFRRTQRVKTILFRIPTAARQQQQRMPCMNISARKIKKEIRETDFILVKKLPDLIAKMSQL